MIINHEMARGGKFCNKGMRKGFLARGLDWNVFRQEGYEEDILRKHFGSGIVDRIIEVHNNGR